MSEPDPSTPPRAHAEAAGEGAPASALRPASWAFPALRYTAWLVGPLALVILFAKVHKLVATPGGDVGSALAALFPDVLFIAAFSTLTWALLRVTRGPLRVAVRVVLHLVVLGLTTLSFIEHGFWLTTGTLLDPYTLGYGLEHIGPLGKVYLSEMGVVVWLGFFALLAVHGLPLRTTRAARAARNTPDRPATPPRATGARAPMRPLAAAAVLGLLPACTCMAALAVDVSPAVEPLSDNVVVEFASEALAPSEAPTEPSAPGGAMLDELVLGKGPRAIPDGPPPNVIIVVMESLRARATSLHDPSLDTTPFLASLAAKGAHADTTWTAVTHTSKAIVGALCGLFPKLDVPIDEAEPTGLPPTCLARVLGEHGYATAFMQPATARFERRDQLVRNMRYQTFVAKEDIPQGDLEETSYFGWEDRALVEPAVAWASARVAEKKPFFLTLLTLSTHHTYGTPTSFAPKGTRAPGELGHYLDAVAYLDGTLKTLFARLEAAGALERTLVVLVGDHGEGFGEHGRRQHDSVIYEEGLHIPLVVFGAGVKPGTRLGGLRSIVDIAPTVLEWLGMPVVSGLPGKSLLSTDGHPFLFASCWLRQRCMATRDATTKYIWHFDKQAPELFDLAADPLEKDNVLPKTPESVWAPMKERLLAWKTDNLARWASFFAEAAREFVTTLPPLPQIPLDITFVAAPEPGSTAAPRPLVRLMGMDLPATRVMSGEPIHVTLHWEVVGVPGSFTPFTHLIGKSANTRPRYNGDHTPVGGRHPTSAWEQGTFVSDQFRLQPSVNLPPGTYSLVVGLWDSTSKLTGPAARADIQGSLAGARPSADIAIEGTAVRVDNERRVHLAEIVVEPDPNASDKVLPEPPEPPPPGVRAP